MFIPFFLQQVIQLRRVFEDFSYLKDVSAFFTSTLDLILLIKELIIKSNG